MNGLDLFSGIGGLSLALRPWVRPIAYCDNDRYAQGVLLSRMYSGSLSTAPIWDDVRTLTAKQFGRRVDIIYGGFPCQDISVAGAGVGLDGERSGLYFEVERLVKELTPTFVFLENVPAIRTRGAERVIKGLAGRGYDCRWTTLSAAEVGAPHKRERWWLLAHARGQRRQQESGSAHGDEKAHERRAKKEAYLAAGHGEGGGERPVADPQRPGREGSTRGRRPGEGRTSFEPACSGEENLGHAHHAGRGEQRGSGPAPSQLLAAECASRWRSEPDVGRMAHGLPARVDRLRGLGNAVVPYQAQEAFRILMGLK